MLRVMLSSILFAFGIIMVSPAQAAKVVTPSALPPAMSEPAPAPTPAEPPRIHIRTPPSRPAPTRNVYEIIAQSKNLTKFAGMIDSAGQKSLFATAPDQPITVFVPTDAALDDVSKDAMRHIESNLVNFVQYHVMSNTLISGSAIKGRKLTSTTANGETIQFDGTDKSQPPKVNDGTVVGEDIPATNGIVHIVSSALVPPSMREASSAPLAAKTPPPPPPQPIKQPLATAAPKVPAAPAVPSVPSLKAVTTSAPAMEATTTAAPMEPAVLTTTTSGMPDLSVTTTTAQTPAEQPVPAPTPAETMPAEQAPATTPETKGHSLELFGHKLSW